MMPGTKSDSENSPTSTRAGVSRVVVCLLMLTSSLSPGFGQTPNWRWWESRGTASASVKKAQSRKVTKKSATLEAIHKNASAAKNSQTRNTQANRPQGLVGRFQMPTLDSNISAGHSQTSRVKPRSNILRVSQSSATLDGGVIQSGQSGQPVPNYSSGSVANSGINFQSTYPEPAGNRQPFQPPPAFQPPPSFRPQPIVINQVPESAQPGGNGVIELTPQPATNQQPQLPAANTQQPWGQQFSAAPPAQHSPNQYQLKQPVAPLSGSQQRQRLNPATIQQGGYSFNFSEAPWSLVLKQFAQEHGMSLQLVGVPSGTFTYFDQRQYTVAQALDILNDHLLSEGMILAKQRENLVLLAANSEIPDGLIPFVQLEYLPNLGRNELATIAIPIEKSDLESSVTEISQFLSDLGRVQPLSNSNRVIVTDTGAYLRRVFDLVTGRGIAAGAPNTFVYELRHSSAEEVATAINSFYSAQAGDSGGGNVAGGQGQQVVIAEKTTNSLLVREGLADNSQIHSMIQQLDRPPREVLIQAVLVEVQLGNTDEFGVEVGFQDSVLFDRSVIDNIVTVTETVTSPVGTQTTNQRIVSQTAAPGFNFNNSPLGNNVTVSPASVAGQALSSFGVGRVNGDLGYGGLVLSAGSESVNVLLRALSARFDIDILSRPQIRAVDNREAMIQIGQQVPVVDGVSVTAVGSANPVIRQDQAGIILKVTPRISPEMQVLIDVQAEKSAFQLAAGTGVPIFTDATNGNVIEAPVKDITTANTTVSVQTGQTIVLGGMITKETAIVERKVPFLGDIPILGHAFRHDINRSSRRELLIFLTPHVIESRAHSDLLKDKEMGHVNMPASAEEFGEQLYGPSMSAGHSNQGCTPANGVPATVGSPSGHGGF